MLLVVGTEFCLLGIDNLYRCTVQLDVNVYVHQLMHLFISPREH
jgi:hypothetical protein